MTTQDDARRAAECRDCGLPYADPRWEDFVVSDETWAKLTSADDAPLLCVLCMIRRAKELGIEARGEFRSGPFCDPRLEGKVTTEWPTPAAQPAPAESREAFEQIMHTRRQDTTQDAKGFYLNSKTADDWNIWKLAWQAAQSRAGTAQGADWVPTHRHYKGGLYQKMCDATHSETDEPLMIYRNEAGRVFARPTEMFDGYTQTAERRFEPIAASPIPAQAEGAGLSADGLLREVDDVLAQIEAGKDPDPGDIRDLLHGYRRRLAHSPDGERE